MALNTLADQPFWDVLYTKAGDLRYDVSKILFKDLFKEYILPGSECFEVGCFPGKYLIYLSKEFGCKVSGIDFTSQSPMILPFMGRYDVKPEHLYNQDFMTFKPERTYDFVFSLGFVEHFKDFGLVIKKHLDLVRPGGTLLLTCPNFRGIQWLLHYLFDRQNLTIHNIHAMDLNAWESLLRINDMKIIRHQPYGTFKFWVAEMPKNKYLRFITKRLIDISNSSKIQLVDFPTKFLSPYLVSVSKKE